MAAIYYPRGFEVKAPGTPIIIFDNGILVAFQTADSNFLVYSNGIGNRIAKSGYISDTCILAILTETAAWSHTSTACRLGGQGT
jgi:hypothetical protein